MVVHDMACPWYRIVQGWFGGVLDSFVVPIGALVLYPNGRAFVAKAKQWRDEAVSSLDREVRVSQNFETSMLALEDPLCAPGLVQAFVESLKGVSTSSASRR